MSYPVKDYMTKEIPTVDSEASALETAKIMAENRDDYLIVLRKAQPAGIVTEGDLLRKVMALQRDPSKVKISEIMSAPLITINPDDAVNVAIQIMVDKDIRRMPVVRDSIIYGVITMRDLVRHFNDYNERIVKDIFRSMSLFHA
jgi:signal-transduction protein with cAMP-binding, CBS, and nucleotidyltransferase domain